MRDRDGVTIQGNLISLHGSSVIYQCLHAAIMCVFRVGIHSSCGAVGDLTMSSYDDSIASLPKVHKKCILCVCAPLHGISGNPDNRDQRITGRLAGVVSLGRGNRQPQPPNSEGVQPMELSTEYISSACGGISENDGIFGSCAHLTDEEAYQSLLKENAALHCLDDNFRSYVMQDFDSVNIQLKALKFQIVSRRAILFRDGDTHWVYKCSCNAVTSDLIDCCENKMEVPFNEFRTRFGDCLHTKTLSVMLENLDAQNQITPEIIASDHPNTPETEFEESLEDGCMEMKEGLYAMNSPKGYGIIQQNADEYKCLTCQSMICRCIHLSLFFGLCKEDVYPKSKHQPSYRQNCYSTERIPFNSTDLMTDIYGKSILERFPMEDGVIALIVERDFCTICEHLLEDTDRLNANLYTTNQILQANVSSKKCASCDRQYYFDGFSICILNMGRNLFCHEILRRFMFYFLTGKTTICTEYSVLRKIFNDSGFHEFEEKMSYQDFKEAWYAFLDLLDINYQDSFKCPKCGPEPDTLVMDATSVAFRKELISWENIFLSEFQNLKPYDTIDTARVKE